MTVVYRALVLPAVTLAAALALTGCGLKGSGTPHTEVREVETFDAIEIGGTFDLVVHIDPSVEQKLEVSGDDNIVPVIETDVRGGTLEVGIDGVSLVRPKTPMKIEVWTPALDAVEVAGSADVDIEGLHGERFELEVAGAADADLSGSVERFELDVAGSGDVSARALEAAIVEIDIAGSGSARVFASESLHADVAGSGKVRYWGKPATVTSDVAGSGTIQPAE